MLLSRIDSSTIRNLKDEILGFRESSEGYQEIAQSFAQLLYKNFEESIVLVRVFLVLSYDRLSASDQNYVQNLASSLGVAEDLHEKTHVLSLMGTAGVEADWNDRRKSNGHLGIPLVSARFAEEAPMVARLLKEIGLGLDRPDTRHVTQNLGSLSNVFHVRDAGEDRDERNRYIVPARDFVQNNKVKSVFGLGGGYLDGTLATILCFSRETLSRTAILNCTPLLNFFKSVTVQRLHADDWQTSDQNLKESTV